MKKFCKLSIYDKFQLMKDDVNDITTLLLYYGASKLIFSNTKLLNYVFVLKFFKL